MDIDPQDGTVRLSNGCLIGPGLTRGDFEAQPIFGAATLEYSANPPWSHYRVPGDATDGKRVSVTVYFYGQVLVSVDISANLYPPDAIGWEHYSDGIEAATKDFHDGLLQHLFSKHANAASFHAPQLSQDLAILKRPVTWPFHWGRVISQHDSRSSTTNIVLWYGDRFAEAQAGTLVAAPNPAVRSEFVQRMESNPEYVSGFEAAKLELARRNTAGAIRLVRETSGMSLSEAQELVASWQNSQ